VEHNVSYDYRERTYEKIIDGLWLGSDLGHSEMKRRGYARLCCCSGGPYGHREMLGYRTPGAPKGKDYLFARRGDWMALNMFDAADKAMIPDKCIDAGLAFIKERRDAGQQVFVHCNHGHSRSPSIMMLYLHMIGELNQGYKQARHVFQTLYPKFSPGQGMLDHIRDRW
jgi:dual specificity protein phosphatase-like protein